jgi:hypothetical protein
MHLVRASVCGRGWWGGHQCAEHGSLVCATITRTRQYCVCLMLAVWVLPYGYLAYKDCSMPFPDSGKPTPTILWRVPSQNVDLSYATFSVQFGLSPVHNFSRFKHARLLFPVFVYIQLFSPFIQPLLLLFLLFIHHCYCYLTQTICHKGSLSLRNVIVHLRLLSSMSIQPRQKNQLFTYLIVVYRSRNNEGIVYWLFPILHMQMEDLYLVDNWYFRIRITMQIHGSSSCSFELISHDTVFFSHNKTTSADLSAI